MWKVFKYFYSADVGRCLPAEHLHEVLYIMGHDDKVCVTPEVGIFLVCLCVHDLRPWGKRGDTLWYGWFICAIPRPGRKRLPQTIYLGTRRLKADIWRWTGHLSFPHEAKPRVVVATFMEVLKMVLYCSLR
jgi:hypothetical protein